MAKRGHGEGTIYKRADGKWRAQVSVGGKRLSKTHTKRSVVAEWLRKTTGQIGMGLTYDQARVSLADHLQRWLAGVQGSLRASTYSHYKLLIDKYLIPSIGDALVKDLSPDLVQFCYDELTRAGVGAHTLIKMHAVLHEALRRAVETGLAARNPSDAARPPAAPAQEMKFWSETEANRFLMAARGNRLYALFYLAIVSGGRQMELCGLQWSDLDWTGGQLRIQRQLLRSGDEIFGPQKTARAKRTISLGAGTLDVLRAHLALQARERRLAGSGWLEHGLIFTSTTGTPVHHKNLVDRYFKPLVQAAGVKPIRFHDLRHTAAAIMLSHGRPPIVVSRILGHARVSITLDIYGHLIPGLDAGVGDMMDELVAPVEWSVETEKSEK
ncbi:MAG: site-specific integrase [Candidatus Omnitrophota bacterium]|jgi:integrase|nr:MAG: site-specific integrase [Candidatus Omnitrophota bacterium]